MHKRFYNILFWGLVASMAACSGPGHTAKTKLAGTWQAQPIIVDGDGKDWPSPYPAYDANAKIGYAISNDKDNLYITVETGDAMTEMKILRAGMTVWIDTGGGKEQSMAINYPLAAESQGMQMDRKQESENAQGGAQNPDREKRMQERARKGLGEALQLSLEGFGACSGGFLVRQNNSCGIKVSMGIDEYNEMIWEAAIPMKVLYGKEHIEKKDEGKALSVCFNIKAFKKPERPKGESEGMNEGGNGMQGGGMRGGGAGMQGGGHRGGAPGGTERESMFEATKTWKQVGLAYKD